MKKNPERWVLPWHTLKKGLRMIKWSLFFFCLGIIQVLANNTYSQQTRFSMKFEKTKLENVLNEIENQSEYYFLYNQDYVDVEQVVNFRANDMKIDEVLSQLLKATGIGYSIYNRQIVLTSLENNNSSVNEQSKITINGKVTDTTAAALPGVSVVVKATTIGTITDFDGKFTLGNVPSDATIQFSFVGMKMQEIFVAGKTSIDVKMEEDAIGLEEVVAVGYGTKKKRDLTGSITSVSGEKLTDTKAESFAQALQGRAAGVYVKSNSGLPGGGVSVRIRGIGGINNSEPLYIIDGIQIGGSGDDTYNPLSGLNPNDIESLEVMKDASSAAIYGARAANGVVIVTTKRGNKNKKQQINYSASYGIQNFTNPNNLAVLNGQEYAEFVNKMEAADGNPAIFGGTNTNTYPTEYFSAPSQIGKGTNWLDLISNENASTQEHQLSLNGGTENHQYYLSAAYLDQNGIIKKTSFKRYSVRINTDNVLTKWLKVGNSFSVSHGKQIGLDNNRTMGGDVVAGTLFVPPTIPAYKQDGSFAGPATGFYKPERTPLAVLMDDHIENRRTDLMGNLYGDIKLLKGLSYRTNISVVMNFNTNEDFTPTYDEGIAKQSISLNQYTYGNGSNWLWNNVLTYEKMFEKHNITALAGMESTESKYEYLTGQAGFGENVIRIVKSVGASSSQFEQNITSSSLISYFGSMSYNFDQKYYLEGNIRRDGSSQFGMNSRWGTFPSVSAAWRISKENFFPESPINDLKFRGSYGEVGNNKIGDFSYIAPLKTVLYSMSGNDSQYNTGTVIAYLANPDLKWETSKQINIGLDLTLFDNKLTINADYFKTNVEDMLLGLQIPAFTGISFSDAEIVTGQVTSNVGSLTNTGFELEVAYNGKIGEISVGINGNITTYNNEITNIGNNEQIWGQSYKGQNISRTIVGGSLGEFYGYVVEGIFQTQAEVDAANALDGDASTPYQYAGTAPGDYKYKDVDGDKKVTSADRTSIGSPIPDFTYGMGLNLGYKDFQISALFVGSQGNDLFFATRTDLESSSNRNANKSRVMLDAWDGPGSTNTVARIISSDPNQNSRISSKFVEDGSYLRLRNIELGYKIPKRLIEKIGASAVQVYISGQNLLTFTKYSGFDPEVGNLSGSNLNAGIDTDLYPQAKSIHIGASISF